MALPCCLICHCQIPVLGNEAIEKYLLRCRECDRHYHRQCILDRDTTTVCCDADISALNDAKEKIGRKDAEGAIKLIRKLWMQSPSPFEAVSSPKTDLRAVEVKSEQELGEFLGKTPTDNLPVIICRFQSRLMLAEGIRDMETLVSGSTTASDCRDKFYRLKPKDEEEDQKRFTGLPYEVDVNAKTAHMKFPLQPEGFQSLDVRQRFRNKDLTIPLSAKSIKKLHARQQGLGLFGSEALMPATDDYAHTGTIHTVIHGCLTYVIATPDVRANLRAYEESDSFALTCAAATAQGSWLQLTLGPGEAMYCPPDCLRVSLATQQAAREPTSKYVEKTATVVHIENVIQHKTVLEHALDYATDDGEDDLIDWVAVEFFVKSSPLPHSLVYGGLQLREHKLASVLQGRLRSMVSKGDRKAIPSAFLHIINDIHETTGTRETSVFQSSSDHTLSLVPEARPRKTSLNRPKNRKQQVVSASRKRSFDDHNESVDLSGAPGLRIQSDSQENNTMESRSSLAGGTSHWDLVAGSDRVNRDDTQPSDVARRDGSVHTTTSLLHASVQGAGADAECSVPGDAEHGPPSKTQRTSYDKPVKRTLLPIDPACATTDEGAELSEHKLSIFLDVRMRTLVYAWTRDNGQVQWFAQGPCESVAARAQLSMKYGHEVLRLDWPKELDQLELLLQKLLAGKDRYDEWADGNFTKVSKTSPSYQELLLEAGEMIFRAKAKKEEPLIWPTKASCSIWKKELTKIRGIARDLTETMSKLKATEVPTRRR